MKAIIIVAVCVLGFVPAQARGLELRFRGASAEHFSAAEEYTAIWREQGERIVATLEAATGVRLPDTRIAVIVLEAQSNSGSRGTPMRLRASYSEGVKRGTLVHELAHRYLGELHLPGRGLSEHQRLNLLLLPVWRALWGDEFVLRQVEAESKWSRDYKRDWQWALAMSESERERAWRELLLARRN